jgi:transcriptional regulator with GAF, ATPase, and Fis domain
MKPQVDLIDSFTELVVGASDPRRLAERTLEVAMAMLNGRAGAVFTLENDRVNLFASRGIDQDVLDAMQGVWHKHKATLERGEAFYVEDRANDKRLSKEARSAGAPSFAVVPVFESDRLIALVYLDGRSTRFAADNGVTRLAKLSRIVGKAVADARDGVGRTPRQALEDYLERTPSEDLEREKLMLLLTRNEWNIARVSRLMNVTRRTIYLRLARFGIARQKIRKTRPRLATA